jgi:phage terminase small subunit
MGKPRLEAHELSGYKADKNNASTLARQPHINARIAELQGRAAEIAVQVTALNTGITKSWVLEQLRTNALDGLRKGKKSGGSSVANRALELIGKEIGMFIDRQEQGKPGDFAHLSDEELDAQLVQRLKAKGMSERQIRTFFLVTSSAPANYDEKESA